MITTIANILHTIITTILHIVYIMITTIILAVSLYGVTQDFYHQQEFGKSPSFLEVLAFQSPTSPTLSSKATDLT